MEILGSTFDDSVFCESRDRVSGILSSYSAKICEPEWFCDAAALDTDDSLEKQKVLKFRGDLAVRQGNYQRVHSAADMNSPTLSQNSHGKLPEMYISKSDSLLNKALDAYNSCLQWISDNNLTIRRDVLEGMSRCYTKLGQRDRALDFVDLLRKEASNTCHLMSLLLLKVSIYQHFGDLGSKMLSLQQLCSLLPFNPWHWFNLGQTCLQLLDNNTCQGSSPKFCESATDQNNENTEEQQDAEFNEDRIWLKACTCLIRSRLLLRILQQQQSSFVLQRSERTLQKTDEALLQLNAKETTLQALTEVMSEDLIPEKMREDYQDGESLTVVCVQSFTERWWKKILQTGVLEMDGPQTSKKSLCHSDTGLQRT